MAIEFAYAQARVQARLGERLTPAAWQLLEASRDLPQYLHAVRATALAPKVQPLVATSSPHAIERSLRRDWRSEVDGAARWAPAPWRPAVAWTAWLCDLPALAWLARGGRVLPWMRDDPHLARFAVDDAAFRRRELAAAGAGALSRDDVLAGWRRYFEASWPAHGSAVAALRRLVDLVEAYRVHGGGPGREPRTRAAARERLETRAVRLVRRSLKAPVTVFSHLLLVALDLGRLRDGLVRRALLDDWSAAA